MILHNKEIDVVVSDFDGTIIKEGMIAPPDKFFAVVEQLFEKGIPFVAASGRQYANLRQILSPIADRINFIAENGCLIVYQGNVVYKSAIERSLAMELIADMQTFPEAEIVASGEITGYVEKKDAAFADMLIHKLNYNMTVLPDFNDIKEDMIKISIHWKDGIPAGPEEWFHKKYDGRLQVADGGNGWLDFNGLGTGKGEALRILAEYMGVPTAKMIAFGDNENDLSMLTEAGISYAVSSAKPHIKEKADYVCDSVEDILLDALKTC